MLINFLAKCTILEYSVTRVINMGIGRRIKAILRNRKMTIKELAELTEIPVNTLYSITKRDSERVDSVILFRIAEELGVTTDELRGIEIDYGNNLRLARKWAGITQKELADKAGIPVTAIQQYESGERRPKSNTWGSLASALNLSPDELNNAEALPTEIEYVSHEEWLSNIVDELKPELLEYFCLLNEDGLYEAVKRMEELTLIPRYQRYDLTDAPESTPPAPETDTAPGKKPPERP